MIVAVLTLAVACGGAATTQPTLAEQQSTTDLPLITPSQAPQDPPTQAPTPSVESPKVKLESILKPELQPIVQLCSSGR